MKRSTKILAATAATALALSVAPAWAAVTFDSATGTGFVGKGDVQEAFGWNDKAIQSNAADITFAYDEFSEYSADCVRVVGAQENIVRVPQTSRVGIDSNVDFDTREKKNKTVTGFNLNGYVTEPSGGSPMVEGGACSVGVNVGTYGPVTVTSTGGQLVVIFNGEERPLGGNDTE
jgi:hypothetical protein